MNLPLLGSPQGFHFSLLSRLPFRGGLIAPWIVMEEFSKRWGSACHWLWAGATLAAFTPPVPLCVQEGETDSRKSRSSVISLMGQTGRETIFSSRNNLQAINK